MDWLRKLGIVRGGSYKATFKNAKEMPTEMVTDTFNAKKETVTKDDISAAKKSLKGKSRLLFWISLIVFLFFLLLFASNGLLGFWSLFGILLWLVFLFLLWRKVSLVAASGVVTIVIVIAISLISFVFVGLGDNGSSKTSGNFNEEKVVKITSTDGSVKGTVGLKPTSSGLVSATYNMITTTEMPTNWVCLPEEEVCGVPSNTYTYINDLVQVDRQNTDEGSFSGIYCNVDQLPSDPYTGTETVDYYGCDYRGGSADPRSVPTTNKFTSNFTRVFNSYDDFLATTTFNVHDGSAYWEVLERTATGKAQTYGVDGERAISETLPTKSFTLIYTEQEK